MGSVTQSASEFTPGATVWAWMGGGDWFPAVVMKVVQQPIVRMEHGVWVSVAPQNLAARDPELRGSDRPRPKFA
jgi:hypothetical protein